jgi:hypothetical protein
MPSYIVTAYLMSRNYFLCPQIGKPYLATFPYAATAAGLTAQFREAWKRRTSYLTPRLTQLFGRGRKTISNSAKSAGEQQEVFTANASALK